jgi:hypothetical protein
VRYRVGDDPSIGAAATDDVLLLTVVMSIVVGIVLIWLARFGKQMWLMVWSIGLVLSSIAYLAWAALS